MPLYEYQCDACGHRFEVIRKFSDPPIAACPKCEGVVQKLQSAPAFQFKGTGWYVTDYAKGGKPDPQAPAKDKDGHASAGSSDSKEASATKADGSDTTKTKGETKSDTKSETKAQTESRKDPAPAAKDPPAKKS